MTLSAVDQAIEFLRAGDYVQADLLLAGLGADKPAADIRLKALRALTLVLRRSFQDGVDAVMEAADRHPNKSLSVFRRLQSSVGPLESVLALDASQEVLLRLGDYFLREGDAAEAAEWLTAACAAVPDDPWAIYLEANCRFERFQERRAIADMEEAAGLAERQRGREYLLPGGVATLWQRIGRAFETLRNLEKAAEYLERAVLLAPENHYQRVWLGDVLFRMGRFQDAIVQLGFVHRFADNYCYAARLRAVSLLMVGRPEEGLALLREIVEIDPLDAVAFRDMGRIHLAQGDLGAAEIALARAFRTAPDLPGLKSLMVQLEGRLGRPMDGDAGLPEITSFAVPREFALKPDDPGLYRVPRLGAAVSAHVRLLGTLMLREILGRYSHNSLGYLWALLHPLIYVATLDALYILAGRQVPLGTSREAFLITGIVPLICFFMNVQSATSRAVAGNLILLYFRSVTPLVLIVAYGLLEYLTALTVFILFTTGLLVFGIVTEINDILTMFCALTLLSVLGAIAGTLFGFGELAMPSFKFVGQAFSRLAFFLSGALYYANELPERMRTVALWNPLLHLIEFVRDGFFVTYKSRYAEWSYPLAFVICGIALTLAVERVARRHVVAA